MCLKFKCSRNNIRKRHGPASTFSITSFRPSPKLPWHSNPPFESTIYAAEAWFNHLKSFTVPARPRLHDEDGTTSCAAQLLRNVIILTKAITPSLTESCEQANGTENRSKTDQIDKQHNAGLMQQRERSNQCWTPTSPTTQREAYMDMPLVHYWL
jgi:hypothetical protein